MTEDLFFNNLITKSMQPVHGEERFFEGFLTVQVKDKQGEITVVDELYKVLPIWMDRGAPISDTHSNRIIGKGINYSKETYKDKDGEEYPAIKITGKIHKDYELDNEIWKKIKSGEYKGLSFGGATKSDRDPVRMKDGSIAYSLKDLEHYEVAVCADPAVPLALITDYNPVAKSATNAEVREDGKMIIKCDKFGCYVTKPIPDGKGGKGDFDHCEEKNQDKNDPAAFCGAIQHKLEKAIEAGMIQQVAKDGLEIFLTKEELNKVCSGCGKTLEEHGIVKYDHSNSMGDQHSMYNQNTGRETWIGQGLPQPTVEGKDDKPAEQGLTVNADARQNSGKKKGRTARNRKRRQAKQVKEGMSMFDEPKELNPEVEGILEEAERYGTGNPRASEMYKSLESIFKKSKNEEEAERQIPKYPETPDEPTTMFRPDYLTDEDEPPTSERATDLEYEAVDRPSGDPKRIPPSRVGNLPPNASPSQLGRKLFNPKSEGEREAVKILDEFKEPKDRKYGKDVKATIGRDEARTEKSLESIFKRDDWDEEEKENTDAYLGRSKKKPWTSRDQSEYDAFEELSKLPKERLDKLHDSVQEAIDGIEQEGKIREGMTSAFGKSLESIVDKAEKVTPEEKLIKHPVSGAEGGAWEGESGKTEYCPHCFPPEIQDKAGIDPKDEIRVLHDKFPDATHASMRSHLAKRPNIEFPSKFDRKENTEKLREEESRKRVNQIHDNYLRDQKKPKKVERKTFHDKAEESNFGAGQRGLGYGNEGYTNVQGSGQNHTISEIPPEMEIIVHDVNEIKESKKEGYTTEAGNNKRGDPSRATNDDDSLLSPKIKRIHEETGEDEICDNCGHFDEECTCKSATYAKKE